MNLSAARVFVSDIEDAKAFYENIGLALECYNPDAQVCIFNTGKTKLILESVSENEPEFEQSLLGRFTGLSFDTCDITEKYERLRSSGVEFKGLPEQQNWGGWLATFLDPSGNELQLVQYTD
ncbi:VOC family protein [Marinomonas mediterranea]|jgi:Glyoxalase/Bleomycin resistance protein/Dioxygenase superfamily.|uniref:Glyoxalase/bleomycin resistance protein/dioxygenase n=1 Tax=Marinomonas mediterranea (strain ATCC 700492 / JCM 21426 / NBRC 103028 / MMB-1) TaxID=717774 RepID=F2JYP1_MARM1|nr:VOC family protein [Marinomonas mediterranea]ADZ89666.1 Glyoxalase/bleomycin resistance protein/dioxygenase [Marinomonas mediterranea MMB-1]WCN07757.1 glyoxalase/bleomycin resistance/dioxygenase family protein [Marinomonas mediterranea]WCN11857.1 glyoxalase/bleomycin resistance/dioxygenase family protein [Marinomonas mediterranea]WCN15902.1 glyoxalase/bleomycin resistance/dioxygenase family protein [Marinomonas mediterranea MMB-1]